MDTTRNSVFNVYRHITVIYRCDIDNSVQDTGIGALFYEIKSFSYFWNAAGCDKDGAGMCGVKT